VSSEKGKEKLPICLQREKIYTQGLANSGFREKTVKSNPDNYQMQNPSTFFRNRSSKRIIITEAL